MDLKLDGGDMMASEREVLGIFIFDPKRAEDRAHHEMNPSQEYGTASAVSHSRVLQPVPLLPSAMAMIPRIVVVDPHRS